MKRFFLLLALLAAVSCVKEGLEDTRPSFEKFALKLTASAPESSVETKTQIADDLSVVWNADDQIKVCFPVNVNLYNDTGKSLSGVSGIFASSSEEGSASAEFSCENWDVDLNEVVNGKDKYNAVGYAFYPASVTFSHNVGNYGYGRDNITASYTIPSEQNAVEGSFERDLNPAYAVVDRDEMMEGTASVQFRNLAALVRINLGEEIDNVNEIRINTANKSAYTVCGQLNFSISTDNDNPGVTTSLENLTDATPVILKRKDGEDLQAGQTYYAVIAPGREHVGLKLVFVNKEGAQVEKIVAFDKNWTVNASDCWTINVKNPIVFPDPTVLEVDAENFDASFGVDSKTFNVTANFDWTVAITSFNSSWLKVTPASGSANGTFTITTEENPDLFNKRSAQVTLTSKEKSIVINVTQDYKKYYVVERLSEATKMKDGGNYVIGFKDTPNKYLHTATSGKLEGATVGSQPEMFTADYVYELEVMEGYSVDSPYGDYPSAFMGTMKSASNGLYWQIFDSAFNQASATHPVVFCSSNEGVFDLYYPQGQIGYFMSYYEPDGNFYWNTTVFGPYQWYIYEVELR